MTRSLMNYIMGMYYFYTKKKIFMIIIIIKYINPHSFKEGRVLSREMKGELVKVLTELLESYQKKRSEVTDEQVREFFAIRPMYDT